MPMTETRGLPIVAEVLDAAVAEGKTAGCVGLVATGGEVLHASAHGLRNAATGAAMTLDSVFQLASMSKALGTAAALKLVEQGRLALDADVAEILPDFAKLQFLMGFDGVTPRFRPRREICTIRHLMTHTSGLGYEAWNPVQRRLCTHLGVDRRTAGRAGLQAFPFLSEPGERWEYSVSTDWLGLATEAVAGEPIETFLKREVLDPLAMGSTDVIFRADMEPRRVPVHAKADGGRLLPTAAEIPTIDYHSMGAGLKGSGPDYLRFLRMILNGGELDGVRVFSPETIALMRENAIGDLRVCSLPTTAPAVSAPLEMFPGFEKTFTLGFMRNETDIAGRRCAGSLCWAGLFNTHYWIDPASGIAAVLMMQQSPFISDEAVAVYDAFERAIYRSL